MSGRLWIVGTALLALVVAADSVRADDEVKFGDIPDEHWQLGAPTDYPEANAVVILSRARLEIGRSSIETKYLFRIKILTEAGIDDVGDRSIMWHKKYDKIKSFEAHTITPDGKKHEVKGNSIFEKQSGNYRTKSFSFPNLSPGCIVEYKFRNISESFRYLEPWDFQTDIYTLRSSFSVVVPAGFTYNVLYKNVPPQFREPTMEERPDMDAIYRGATIRTYTWTRSNLPPITDEPYMSCEDDYRSSLRFQLVRYEDPHNNINFLEPWPKLGEYKQRDFDDYCNKDDEVEELAEEVTAGLTDPQAISRAIHAYIVSEISTDNDYTSYYYANDKMSDLLETKSGSGEEKNLLFVEMHRASGLQAWPVLISTRGHAKLDPDNPDLRQFNYIIAYVQFQDGFQFIDCANRLSPYGLLPPHCLTNGGLLVNGDQSQLIRIRERGLYSARNDRTRMYVDGDGLVTCSTNCDFRGYYASDYGRRYERKDPEEFVKDYFVDRLDCEYDLGEYNCRLDSADSFVMTVDYTTTDLTERLDKNLLVRPVNYAYRENPFKSEKRFFPIDFTYPYTYHYVVEVFVLDSIAGFELPPDIEATIAGASFTRQSRLTDTTAIVEATMTIDKPEFLPAAYSAIRDFFDQVALATEDEVVAILAAE